MSSLGAYQTPWVRIQRLLNAQRQGFQSLTDTMAGMVDLEAKRRVSERPILPVPGDPSFEPGGRLAQSFSPRAMLPPGVGLGFPEHDFPGDAYYEPSTGRAMISPEIFTSRGGPGTLAHEGAHATELGLPHRETTLAGLEQAFGRLPQSEQLRFFRTAQEVMGYDTPGRGGTIENRYGVGGPAELYADIAAVIRVKGSGAVPATLRRLAAFMPPVSEWMPQRDEAAALGPQEKWAQPIPGRPGGVPGPGIGEGEGGTWLGRRVGEVAEPAYEYGVKPAIRAVQYVEEPVAAAALGAVSRAGPLGGPALGPSQQIGETPMERAPIGEELVNPVSAWLGDEEEQRKAREVLDEAGLPAEIMAYFFTSPLNLLPIVGFTSGKGFLNTLRQAMRVTGDSRAAIIRSPRFQSTIAAIRRGGAEEAQALGPRVPGVGPEDVVGVTPGGGPPIEPPKPSAAPPPLPEPPDWQGVAARVSERIPEAQRTYKITDLARRAELGKRTKQYFARLDELLGEGMSGEEARKAAMAEFGGELPDVKFADALWISPEEVDALNGRVIQYMRESNHPLEANTAMDAITSMTAKRVPRPHEIRAIRKVFGDDLARTIEKASRDKDTWKTLMDLWMVPKAIRSSFDLSFPFRQGIMVSGRHPLMFGNSIKTTARAFADPDWMARETTRMLADKTAIPVKMADGSSVDLMLGQIADSMGIVVERAEPFYRGQLAERLWLIGPGVKRSNVAFTGAGNKLRYDMARYWLNRWTRPQSMVDVTPERLQSLGNLLNALTGRATIPKGQLFDLMQAAWWSPQYRLSGPQVLATGIRHGFFPGGDKEIAKIAAQNLAVFVGGGIGILSLLKTSGLADVEIDPRSTDFGKVQMGPTRINFWGTSQLLARTIAQSITQTRLDPAVGPVARDPGQVWAKWAQSGLSPQISLIWDWATGEAYLGEPLRADERRGVSWGDIAKREAQERAIPLAWLDIKDGIEEDALRGGLTGATGILGLGVQSYDPASQALRAIPRYEGLDARQSYEISRFARKSEARLDELRLEFGTEAISGADRKMMLFNIALEMGMDEETAAAAAVLTSSNTTQKELLNPEWLKFVLQNWDELRVSNPELAMSNYILEARERAKEQGLVK